MSNDLYTRWDLNPQTIRFTPRRNKTGSFEKMVMCYVQRTRPDYKLDSFYRTGIQNKSDSFKVDSFCSQYIAVLETMGCFYHFCSCQDIRPTHTEEDTERGSKKESSIN